MKLKDRGWGPKKGLSAEHRARLELLHREGGEPFPVEAAARILDLPLPRTRRLLAHLAAQGWLVRVRRGLYATVPLEAADPSSWQVDPWTSAAEAFAPCYIGGWSACEHWGLTDQLFREVVVMTARRVPHRKVTIQDTDFRLKHVPEASHFGLVRVWRGRTRVAVSDPSRTVVDMLDDPALVGGLRHGAEILSAYFEERLDEARLLDYAARLGNRAVFKRLGYLAERLGLGSETLRRGRELLSAGYPLLDPSAPPRGPHVSRWRLRINVSIGEGDP